jgi:hypothetical protein
MDARYRKDYQGEFVIINTDIRRGIKQQKREWIANPIINQHVSNRAAVIGSDIHRSQFDYARLQRHRGGLQGKKRLQTYSHGNTWQSMRLDFFCSTDRGTITKVHNHKYYETSVIYTAPKFCLMYPECFYMVPYQPVMCDLASSLYLALFDGHEEIYMIGYSNETPSNDKRWKEQITDVMQSYSAHEFILVGGTNNLPDQWRSLANVRCMDYRQFVSHCDI